ncbi:MAG TPA: hypothetical protein VF484_08075 [Candidatus Limnocylindrales bacterium]
MFRFDPRVPPVRPLVALVAAIVLGSSLAVASATPANAGLNFNPCLLNADECSTLSITPSGDGHGLIESTNVLGGVQDNLITCERVGGADQGTCQHLYYVGPAGSSKTVYLFEEPFGGFNLCVGATCSTTPKTKAITLPPNVHAVFAPAFNPIHPVTLSVGMYGEGSGTITSSPAGINCPTVCAFDFNAGTQVTVTVTPDSSSRFELWTAGPCGDYVQPVCTFTIDTNTWMNSALALSRVYASHPPATPLPPAPTPKATGTPHATGTPTAKPMTSAGPTGQPAPSSAPAASGEPAAVSTDVPPTDQPSAVTAPADTGAGAGTTGGTAGGGATAGSNGSPSRGASGDSSVLLLALAIVIAGLLVAVALLLGLRRRSPAADPA